MRVGFFQTTIAVFALATGVLLAQRDGGKLTRASGGDAEDMSGVEDQAGFRMTPELARAFVRFPARGIARRYEIDESRQEEVQEMFARHLMEMFHRLDTPESQAAAERLVANFMEMASQGGGRFQPTKEQGRQFAKDLLPLMPAYREMVRAAGQELRPMMSPKQQLKLAGELATFNMAIDGFENTLEQWAEGDVTSFRQLFRSSDPNRSNKPPLDENGMSNAYKDASEHAGKLDLLPGAFKWWDVYVEEAKALYGFDASQQATADSILREAKSRSEALAAGQAYASRLYSYGLWDRLLRHVGPEYAGDNHPLRYLLQQEDEALRDELGEIGNEMKKRILTIPRSDQRRSAERRLSDKLAELGFDAATEGNAHAN